MLRAIMRVATWVLLAASCVPARVNAQPVSPPLSLLDVPFISQSELLCGGAAAAMVLRYWGERGIDAEAFASLVDRSAAGIRTNALIDNLRGRGYTVSALSGTADTLARELGRGRPIVVLIEDRPGTFHYIVLVGVTDRAVVFHDPARTPFRVMSRDEFDRRWAPAERWMALVLPEALREPKPATTRAESGGGSCDVQVKRGVQQAQANQLDEAARTLTAALTCDGPAPMRELAGVRLLQKRWPEVTDLAAAALTQDPKDEQAWRLLATGRFVQEDRLGALEAWNRVGEPRVDLVAIRGLSRTRQRVAERVMDVPPNALLTPGLFTVARRRLRDLPSASTAQLEYVPVTSGLAELRGTVTERPPIPNDRVSFAILGTDAVFRRQIEVSFGPFTGGGDRLTLGWRFWSGRPRLSASFTVPAPWGGGIWGVDAFTERQPFLNDVVPVAHRHGAHLGASLWSTHWMRTTIRGGTEIWREIGEFGLVGGGVRVMTPDDRVDLRLELTRWIGRSDPSFGTAEIGATLRSTTEHRGRVWIARLGTAAASPHTPPDIWFAGDTGRARGVPLRAHPVIDGGKLDPQQIGRRIQFVSGEVQNWWSYRTKLQIGAATFVDSARASQRVFPDAKADVDVGVGARLSAPGFGGVLRIDIAHGLRDGDDALSFVYEP